MIYCINSTCVFPALDMCYQGPAQLTMNTDIGFTVDDLDRDLSDMRSFRK